MSETSKPHMTPRARIEGLRNLRTGYESVTSAVGFWESLHGEDVIEEYAGLFEQLESTQGKLEQVWSEAKTAVDLAGGFWPDSAVTFAKRMMELSDTYPATEPICPTCQRPAGDPLKPQICSDGFHAAPYPATKPDS